MSSKNSNNSSSTAKPRATRNRTRATRSGLVRTETRDTITAYELMENGLTVLYAHVPGSITVTTSIVYLVGSRHEETGDTGLAHMLEHMLFKKTTGKGTKWKDLENKGAHLNATTWLDRTLYYFNLPREYLGAMLEVEADRMRNTVITEGELMPERASVLSEYELRYGSKPEVILESDIASTAFQNHGYHHETIGWRTDIEQYTVERLKRFYDRHYWPNNATLIVAGDIDEATLAREVERHFGHIPRGDVYTGIPRIEPQQQGLRRTVLRRETPLRVFHLAYKAPAFNDPDWLALMLGLNYLNDGETGPFYRALVDTHLATTVSASLYPTHDPYLAYITAYALEKVPYVDIERTLLTTIERAKRMPIPAHKLALLKESLLATEMKSRDGSHAVALTLSEYVATGDWRRYTETIRAIEHITTDDVSRALNTYLTLDRATIGTLEKP